MRDRSAFYPLNEEILLVIPAQVDTDGPPQTDYLAFLCWENLLMTIHHKPVFRPEDLAMLRESQEWLAERSIAAIVAGVMIDLSLEGLRRNTELRDSILALEERMDQKPDTVHADDILELRAELLMLSAVVSDQLPALQALNVTEKPFFQLSQSGEHLNCAVANLQAADGSLGRLDKRIVALRTGFQMHAQEKTNRRLGMLTILSAIFMPITLMAGIWGMNFENMPELKQPYAYPVALGAMALIGAGMFRFFRTNRWFD